MILSYCSLVRAIVTLLLCRIFYGARGRHARMGFLPRASDAIGTRGSLKAAYQRHFQTFLSSVTDQLFLHLGKIILILTEITEGTAGSVCGLSGDGAAACLLLRLLRGGNTAL